jgi:hypothetical protein
MCSAVHSLARVWLSRPSQAILRGFRHRTECHTVLSGGEQVRALCRQKRDPVERAFPDELVSRQSMRSDWCPSSLLTPETIEHRRTCGLSLSECHTSANAGRHL